MTSQYYIASNNTPIVVESTPFASGGEGNLYRILSPEPYQDQILKCYHTHKRSPEREHKLEYLVRNPPSDLDEKSIAWPIDMVYDGEDKFVGFTMPYLEGEKLEVLTMMRIPKKLRKTWNRFDFSHKSALKLRLKLCFNLAAALHRIHDTQRYVMIDLKPDNILIRPDGTVSMVDMDSIAVVDKGTTLFDAPVATPEYTPPETYRIGYKKEFSQQETWDRFSMAIIYYKLLFGVHPFAGTCGAPYRNANSLDAKIKHGLFVHTQDPNKQKTFEVVPQPHKHFKRIHPSLQNLFWRCFDKGHFQPGERPSADEWCYTILTSQEVQQKYVRPSELFDIKVPDWDKRDLLSVKKNLPVPVLELPRVIAEVPKPDEYIKFKPYPIFVEIRFINAVIFIMALTMLTMSPFSLLSISSLWILVMLLCTNDFYGYFFRKEFRGKRTAHAQLKRSKENYLRYSHSVKPYFAKMKKLWKKIQVLDEQIPKDQINVFLDNAKALRKDEDVFYSFLEEQDADVQVIIGKEENDSKRLRTKYDTKLKTNPRASAIEGETVSDKLQTLLYQENQEIGEVEQKFLKLKETFEANLAKLNRIRELTQQASQLEETLERIQDGTYERLEQEALDERIEALRKKKVDQIGNRNDIAAIAPELFKDQARNVGFIEHLVDNILGKNHIHRVTDIQNVMTIPPPERYYWEDKVHHIFLLGKTIKIPERYDESTIQNALNTLAKASEKLSEEIQNIALTTEEEQALKDAYNKRIERYQKNVKEKQQRLEQVQTEKADLLKDLEGEDISTLENLEEDYKQKIQKIKHRYQQTKDFLKSMVQEFVEEKEHLGKGIREKYALILEKCEEKKEHFANKIGVLDDFLSPKDYEVVQTYLKERPFYFEEKIKLEQEYQKQFDAIERESIAYVRLHKKHECYKDVTFRNHLKQLFSPRSGNVSS